MHFEWSALWDSVWKVVSSEGAPAWVQAIGSIMALIIAIRVSRISIEHAGLLKQKTIFSIAEAAHEYASKVRAAIDLISDEPGSNAKLYDVYHRDVTAGIIRALQGVPVHELASGPQVSAILGLTNHFVFLGDQVDKLLVAPSTLPHVSEMLKSMDENREGRRQYLITVMSVLKKNALGQLDRIDEHYYVLKRSLAH